MERADWAVMQKHNLKQTTQTTTNTTTKPKPKKQQHTHQTTTKKPNQTKNFSSSFFNGGKWILCLNWNIPAVIWEILICSVRFQPVYYTAAEHTYSFFYFMDTSSDAVGFVTDNSYLVLLFRQNDCGMCKISWFIKSWFYSDFCHKHMCACSLAA